MICQARCCVMTVAFLLATSVRASSGFAKRGATSPRNTKSSMSFFFQGANNNNIQRTFSSDDSASSYYTVGITGASGLLGSSLIDELGKQQTLNGKPLRIVKLTRSSDTTVGTNTLSDDDDDDKATVTTTLSWNPKATSAEEVIDPDSLNQIDAIVHLAGENVATGLGPLGFLGIRPWTAEKKKELINSRVGPTEGLAKAIAASKTPTTFLAASGVGAYGADFIGETKSAVDETMDISTSTGFLADLSKKWEAATRAAEDNNRVVNCRMGVVMSKKGGALAKLYPIFFLGGGK